MNSDVFRAILAMDSYNRGYGAGVNDLAETGSLGSATIRAFGPGQQADWQARGFYASAYSWNGRTVISYRGTNPETAVSKGRDICNGWRLGAAIPFGGQPELAKAA